jgi:hypothetical protein
MTLTLQNFSVLSKGGTQQISLMNVAMELKKASYVTIPFRLRAQSAYAIEEIIPTSSTELKTVKSRSMRFFEDSS